MALRNQADAICEKPIVLNPWNVDALREIEKETGKHIYTILQLRHHKSIIDLKEKIDKGPKDKIYDVDLTYITSRGAWYYRSWKGNIEKSGGIATNIGVHFFDMLTWIFGEAKENVVHQCQADSAAGFLLLGKARVRWFLSLDSSNLPKDAIENNKTTYRSITVDGEEIEFSDGFTDLHTLSYQHILNGTGYRLTDARQSIVIVENIRNKRPVGRIGNFHPLMK
jgi:UDP-N-acetyl-2-amino-2-deoxyglucuronate dehydrogenase